ncbi:lipopolysaccharide heptosyltransferase 1 [mine drainage metagenome]|uniref:Lipopolysaccharide heptosyltransferase 1 n=1 Tax=mine drainage metagenome TaxID=410659 RepID=A0A1J5STU1_9ZZZZ
MTRAVLPLRWGRDGLPAAPRRILLVQISALGDQVQTLPAVSDIAARWPDAEIDWAVDARFADIARQHPAVRRVFALPLKGVQQAPRELARWRALLAELRALRARRYDVVWDPHSVLKSAIVARLAKSPLRVGYSAPDCGGEPLAARAYHLNFSRPPGIHGTEGRRLFARAVLDTDTRRPVDYAIRHAFPASNPELPAYAVLAHGASKPEKLWPVEHWRVLGERLIAQDLQLVLPWGNAAERDRAERLIAAWPAGRARLADRGGITDMARLLAGAALVVGVDTGFSHLAAALRRPLVMLFTSTGAELFTPEDPAISRALGGNGVVPRPDAAWLAAQQALAAAGMRGPGVPAFSPTPARICERPGGAP